MSEANKFPPQQVREVVIEVTRLLKERGETVSVAETAAGGIISASILSTPGASKVFKGGLTVYTLESRIAFAGWTQENITSYKGPTPDLVAGIAEHVRGKLGSTYCICESGTAGPGASGEGANRQPGYVALAIATENGTYKKDLNTGLGGDREGNMILFAKEALMFLKDVLKGGAKI
ncbi:putative competence/damage-inducible CinA family protein [Sclerotinia borealis F-4128]|uniref:Putative competence/damage-inducible CinA family protein n=1 Tax=Sclerotinia borealis (strain F-4128) TaxID=1432307 RepID=W9CQ23_SCLBF|nr:putative competence/damage-inducible CinA family protein [Sclerotinia borealis F-4128]